MGESRTSRYGHYAHDYRHAWLKASSHLKTLQAHEELSGVGFGTIQRAKNGDGNITVQNLEAIARAFRRRGVDLMDDAIDSYVVRDNISQIGMVVQEPPTEERELLMGYRDAVPAIKEELLHMARRATEKKYFTERSETK